METQTVLQSLRQGQLRWFCFQTGDPNFILMPDLPSSYLLHLCINSLEFQIENFFIDYTYPFPQYIEKTLREVSLYTQEVFLFNLENYYHSVDYALGFFEKIIQHDSNQDRKYILHTFKTSLEDCKNIMELEPRISCIIRSDLEYFFLEFFGNQKSLFDIPNILYRDQNNKIIITRSEDVVYDLGEYIFGAYHKKYHKYFMKNKQELQQYIVPNEQGYIYDNYTFEQYETSFVHRNLDEAMLTTGRGCQYGCSYCYRSVKYSKVRQIPLEVIEADLEYLAKEKYHYICFYDDCFLTTNANRLEKIIQILARYPFEYGIASRYEMCSRKNLELLSKIKIERLQVGLQSVSREVNKYVKRPYNREKFSLVMENLRDMGIPISLDIILGIPYENLYDFLKTFHYALSFHPKSIFINELFLNPGTQLYLQQEEYGIETQKYPYPLDLFRVRTQTKSNFFSKDALDSARKYVLKFANGLKDTQIILR